MKEMTVLILFTMTLAGCGGGSPEHPMQETFQTAPPITVVAPPANQSR